MSFTLRIIAIVALPTLLTVAVQPTVAQERNVQPSVEQQVQTQIELLENAKTKSPCVKSVLLALKNKKVRDLFISKAKNRCYVLKDVCCIERPRIPGHEQVLFNFDCAPPCFCIVDPQFLVVVDHVNGKILDIKDPYLGPTSPCRSLRTADDFGSIPVGQGQRRSSDAALPKMAAKVYSVNDLELAILPSFPPKALITAKGRVTSTGWSNARLIPYVYIKPPADGMYEFDFVADRPSGISLPVLTPITARYIDANLTGVRGFRVYASSNHKEIKLDKKQYSSIGKAQIHKAKSNAAPDLPIDAKKMMALEEVRLHHHLWHFVRNQDLWNDLPPASRQQIIDMGWQAPRFDGEPGSGLDFLFMHRLMIKMMDKKLAEVGDKYWDKVKGWDPIPWNDADPEWPVPQWTNPHPDAAWARHPDTVAEMKEIAKLIRDPEWLKQRTLDEVGIAIEWSIHGWMHLRWSGPPPADISSTDVSNDWLFIPWSSHVNKHFWKLHGWIDERITDWEKATGQTADFSSAWAGAPSVLPDSHRANLRAFDFIPSIRRRVLLMGTNAQVIEELRRALSNRKKKTTNRLQ